MATPTPPPPTAGAVINDRYEIRTQPGKGPLSDYPCFPSWDRVEQRHVVLQWFEWPCGEALMRAELAPLHQEVARALRVQHPNVWRLHRLEPSPWGPMLVLDPLPRQTLHGVIRRQGRGELSPSTFRAFATQLRDGLAAIHAEGLAHGDLRPANIFIADYRVLIVNHGLHEVRALLDRPPGMFPADGAQPDGGMPHFMSPERLRGAGPSREDDLYALGLCLLETWTRRVLEPGTNPRERPLAEQARYSTWRALVRDEVRQVFRLLHPEPRMRPAAHALRFLGPTGEGADLSLPWPGDPSWWSKITLLATEDFLEELDEDGAYAGWVEAPMRALLLELRDAEGQPVERPAVLEEMAKRAVRSLMSKWMGPLPMVAGWIGSRRVAVSLVNTSDDEARDLLERVRSTLERSRPDDVATVATIVASASGRPARTLFD